MGKTLKGKECGKGICQRKDGLYSARFINKQGKRSVKCFSTLQEARNWLEDARYADKHDHLFVPTDITVDAWFQYWIENAVDDIKYLTVEEQKKFLEAAERSHNYAQYALILETGLRTGEPAKNSSYDTHLYKLCDEAGIKRFCMHTLRHTYATRAIESGMQPKVLQKLLGHASIKTTMDRYVHVTDDSMSRTVLLFEQNQQVQNGTVMVQ